MKSKVSLLLSLCLLFNGLNLRLGVLFPEHDALSELLENQPVVQSCYALSVIPLKIVSKLLANEDVTGTARPGKKPKDTASAADSSSEFTLPAPQTRLESSPDKGFTLHTASFSTVVYRSPISHAASSEAASGGGMEIFKLILLLIILSVLLPRSCIDRIFRIVSLHEYPIWKADQIGYFYFRE